MAGASYEGGDPFTSSLTPNPDLPVQLQRCVLEGIKGWLFMLDGAQPSFIADVDADRMARRILFSNE